MDIVIHYNAEDGYEDQALALARRLFAHFDTAIDSLALIPVADEDLDLLLNGELLRSLSRSGKTPLVADVVRAMGNCGQRSEWPGVGPNPRPDA
ncbi:MAG: hypothetical protein ACRDGS_08605 [Chloroflexota bacterium]